MLKMDYDLGTINQNMLSPQRPKIIAATQHTSIFTESVSFFVHRRLPMDKKKSVSVLSVSVVK